MRELCRARHVFVANMTGPDALLIGALSGGRIGARLGAHRGHTLRTATATSVTPVGVGVLVAAVAGQPVPQAARYGLIITLAIAMGVQNATARRLAVPDLTTTVLTLTLTGIEIGRAHV